MTQTEHMHVSQLAVERFIQGEMAPEERRRFEDSTRSCVACGRLLAETEADDRAFALRPVPAAIRTLAESTVGARFDRARANTRSFFRPWFAAFPAAAAAALVAFLLWPDSRPAGEIAEIGQRGGDDVVRVMGGGADSAPLSLGFHVSRLDGARSVGAPGERLGAGDKIQFFYDAPAAAAFALVGVDGNGAVTTYFSAKDGADALKRGAGLSLGGAIELDDAKGAERFFLCAGENARNLAAVEAAARSLAVSGADLATADRLPFGCDQASVWIRKE